MSVCLIVGCDKGIGRAMALQLLERGDTVIAACLGDSEELRSRGIQVESNIDVCDDASVKAMAKRLKDAGTKIDVLVNVAGVLGVDKLGEIDYDDVRRQFEINAIGPLLVVESLLGRVMVARQHLLAEPLLVLEPETAVTSRSTAVA